jgi:hypothetical protein
MSRETAPPARPNAVLHLTPDLSPGFLVVHGNHPETLRDLVLEWVRERRCRHFVVTIKFKGQEDYAQLDVLKREMPRWVESFQLLHLCANKNEACVFGTVGNGPLKNAG